MRRVLRYVASPLALATVAFLVVLALKPIGTRTAVDVYVLAVGAMLLIALVGATREAAPSVDRSPFEQALRRAEDEPERPAELTRLEREVYLAVGDASYLHNRLRPTLRTIAETRLFARRGLDLDRGGEAVRDAVGAEAWELVRPDRPEPRDRHASGIPIERLRAIVAALERI